MINRLLRRTVLFSFFSHLALFGIFGFTFANRSPGVTGPDIYFWGESLWSADLTPSPELNLGVSRRAVIRESALSPNKEIPAFDNSLPVLKPQVVVAFNRQKTDLDREELAWIKPPKLKEPVIIFHPSLPHDFSLYFSDRQVAHVELDFRIAPHEELRPVLVKRKISSGNLEVDLLIQRNIEHYLFIQESRFAPGKWQTVKIDLTGEND
jgi:hypothetical protein